ncbi:hypothetical protein N7488_002751 [Penicillium malachiteum]|nr:hypothetical protein N7488_002751 [Penicillium malachiteum]
MSHPVLIIGAGLGGVCLAQALHKNNIPFKLFEQDERHNLRSQGYRLRITEHGVNALEQALTPELFTIFEKTCATTAGFGIRVKPDGTSTPSSSSGGLPGPPPSTLSPRVYTVDRSTFREAMLTGLEEHVFFGKSFMRYEEFPDKIFAHFVDGTSVDGILLVGADGVRSRVRKQFIPNFSAIDTGMRIVFGKTPITEEYLAATPENHRTGMSLVTDPDDKNQPTLMFESIHFPHTGEVSIPQLPDPYMYWVLVFHHGIIPFSDEKSWRFTPEEAADLARQLTVSWDPALQCIITHQDASQSSVRSLLSAPMDIAAWESSVRVTLLGDAVHVMPPTGAMGANTALRDASDLVCRILKAGGTEKVDSKVIGEYETELREFAKKAIYMSWKGGMKSFGLRPIEECKSIVL